MSEHEAAGKGGHTPGPWRVEQASWDEETGDVRYTLDDVKGASAADARLIAAAPDLLEALQAVDQQTFCDCLHDGIGEHQTGCFVPLTRAAISKATTTPTQQAPETGAGG